MYLRRFLRRSLGSKNAITPDDIRHGWIDVEIDHAHGGFFANLNWCLYVFAYAKANSLVPRVSLISRNYRSQSKNRDWFGDYFRYNLPIQNEKDFLGIRKKRICHVLELGFTIHPDLTMRQAHNVFFETVTVQDSISEEVDKFIQRNYFENHVLGIHYRGTDKDSEAPRISYECVERHLNVLLESDRFLGVFLASDEQNFIDFMAKKISGVRIMARDDSCRSVDGNPIHLRQVKGSANRLGLDAIVNCMLLSRCHSVLRTSSFLSAWASIFNPDLHVYLLNRPHTDKLWYPEREILEHAKLLWNASND